MPRRSLVPSLNRYKMKKFKLVIKGPSTLAIIDFEAKTYHEAYNDASLILDNLTKVLNGVVEIVTLREDTHNEKT